jgi:uncharacterized protein
MTLTSFGSVIAFKTHEGLPMAFHTENLELANISDEAFACLQKSLKTAVTDAEKEVLVELINWSNSNRLDVQSKVFNGRRKIDQLLINNTQICNLKCIYCAAGGDGTYGDPVVKISIEKTLPQLEFFLKKLSKGDQFRINFAGGEPLLHPEIIEAIYDFAQSIAIQQGVDLKIVVTTNGTCIDANALRVLKKSKSFINISIDGPAKVNDIMRPQKNGESVTAKVIEGILKLVSEKSNLGGIGLTAVFNEMHTDVLATYEFFRGFTVDWYEFNFSHTEKSPEASDRYAEALPKVLARAWEVGGESELLKIRSVNLIFKRLDQRQKVSHFCGIRQNLLVIDARNEFYACPWDVGNKARAINKSEIQKELDGSVDTNKVQLSPTGLEKLPCQSCWMRNLCGGGCEFIHNNSGGIDKNFCGRMKSLIQSTFIYYEKSRRV